MNNVNKIFFTTLALLFSSISQADTFDVEVEINNVLNTQPLTIVQTQAMSFPVITIDEASTEGTFCYASNRSYENGGKTTATSLCPNIAVPESQLTISGTKNASVSISTTSSAEIKNGFRFDALNSTSGTTVVLSNTDGTYVDNVWGKVTLVDKSAVVSGLITFSFDETVAYQ
ncbi:hypothetical protein KIH87_05760 [Paraneptunicella aestuarii]|uniref:hypothetical protein n=1 Tax=Paraneptunicella aestuarii TaxID=2831148 RepID=UPI001E3C24AD|nr:hypothetical protein [Paraneptunicella aestuarii]UAA39859.1 hypothetical protein KIH87_05760 [Paraneptunicella aestuarii]